MLGGIVTTLLASCTGNYLDYNTNPYEVTKDEMGRDGYNLSAALIGMESYVVPVEVYGVLGCILTRGMETKTGGIRSRKIADRRVE